MTPSLKLLFVVFVVTGAACGAAVGQDIANDYRHVDPAQATTTAAPADDAGGGAVPDNFGIAASDASATPSAR